ncbi:maltose permease MAL61 protein [Rutstroemia sp. NJR-2017a BBW]|nr:maltose permease MAL61 protein [Rutstroemia sp. NJR-2017a BBW]
MSPSHSPPSSDDIVVHPNTTMHGNTMANEGPLHFPEEDHLNVTKSTEQMIKDARSATEKEHNMSLLQGLRLYPKAVAWSILISTCIAMEGYDVSLLNNFYAFPQFNKKYGEQLPDGTYQVPARWQAGLSNVRETLFDADHQLTC